MLTGEWTKHGGVRGTVRVSKLGGTGDVTLTFDLLEISHRLSAGLLQRICSDHLDLRRTGRPHREGRLGARPCPYVLVGSAQAVPFGCDATHQGPLFSPDPDGVSRPA